MSFFRDDNKAVFSGQIEMLDYKIEGVSERLYIELRNLFYLVFFVVYFYIFRKWKTWIFFWGY